MNLRQSRNNVFIEGIVSENNLHRSSYVDQRTGKNVNFVGGHTIIKVTQPVDGIPVEMDIRVESMATEFKLDGNPNLVYAELDKKVDGLISIARAGEEGATAVRISRGELVENMYSPDGTSMRIFPRVKANFINIIPRNQLKPRATFDIEVVVGGKGFAVDREGQLLDPMRYDVSAATVQYKGVVDKLSFTTYNREVANFFEQKVNLDPSAPSTILLQGLLNFSTEEITEIEELAVGQPIKRTKTRQTTELLIQGVSEPYQGDFAYTLPAIQAGLAERDLRIEKAKEKGGKTRDKATPSPAPAKGTAAEDYGF